MLLTPLALKAIVAVLKYYFGRILGINSIKSQNVFKISCLTGQERITVVKDQILNVGTTDFQCILI